MLSFRKYFSNTKFLIVFLENWKFNVKLNLLNNKYFFLKKKGYILCSRFPITQTRVD